MGERLTGEGVYRSPSPPWRPADGAFPIIRLRKSLCWTAAPLGSPKTVVKMIRHLVFSYNSDAKPLPGGGWATHSANAAVAAIAAAVGGRER